MAKLPHGYSGVDVPDDASMAEALMAAATPQETTDAYAAHRRNCAWCNDLNRGWCGPGQALRVRLYQLHRQGRP